MSHRSPSPAMADLLPADDGGDLADTLTTSPLLFGYPGREGRLTAWEARSSRRFRLAGRRVAEILLGFLDPQSGDPAVNGLSQAELSAAREAGLLVTAAENERLSLWERHAWSRAAYLIFTQMDLFYLEAPHADEDPDAIRARRRFTVEQYDGTEPYPEPAMLATGSRVILPDPAEVPLTLGSLSRRRSARAFAGAPSAEQLAGVMHAATASFRVLAADRNDPDRFRLLNSFYSWAHLFVVVQDVTGLAEGIFEYDWRTNALITAAPAPANPDLAACVQGQRWVLGPGFAVFVVADLRGYAWLYRHSRAYMHLLMQAGELAQELLMAATALGLGGWTTPAVHESRVATLLGLSDDDAVEAISMVKLGVPVVPRQEFADDDAVVEADR